MKDKGMVWEVEYQLKRHFGTERAARRFYKKSCGREDLKSVLIRHRIQDNAERIVNRIMTKIYDHLDLGRTLKKLTITEQKRIKRVQMKIVSEILEDILT